MLIARRIVIGDYACYSVVFSSSDFDLLVSSGFEIKALSLSIVLSYSTAVSLFCLSIYTLTILNEISGCRKPQRVASMYTTARKNVRQVKKRLVLSVSEQQHAWIIFAITRAPSVLICMTMKASIGKKVHGCTATIITIRKIMMNSKVGIVYFQTLVPHRY